MPITAKLHLNLVTECLEKSLPFIGAGDKERNSSGLPIPRIFLRNKLTLNCHNRRSMKLFSMFHWRMVALGYHVHCDQNKRTQRLFITLDLRYRSRVTFAEWPLWCFPLPTDTDTQLSRTLGPHGLSKSETSQFRSYLVFYRKLCACNLLTWGLNVVFEFRLRCCWHFMGQ